MNKIVLTRDIKDLSKQKQEGERFRLFKGSKVIVITGIVGVLLSVMVLLAINIKGSYIPPDGNLFKPFSFNAALGLFLINLGAFLPLASFTKKGLQLWQYWTSFAAFGAYIIETVQPLRGVDPRFARNHEMVDIIIGAVGMSFFSILIMILTIIYAWKLFTSNCNRSLLLYSIKWSMTIIFIGFSIGIIMMIAILSADYKGEYQGFVWIWSHGFAFHSLQALPLLAWLLEKSPLCISRKLINIVGVIWLFIIILLNTQTFLRQKIYEGPTFYMELLLLIIYFALVGYAVKKFVSIHNRRTNNNASANASIE